MANLRVPVIDQSRIENRIAVSRANVSIALLTVSNSALNVAIVADDIHCLPAILPVSGQSLDQLAKSQLSKLVGTGQGYMEQLYTFSFDDSDGPEIVVSYLALTPGAPALHNPGAWLPISGAEENLPAHDRVVLDYALVRLRAKIGYTTIAFHLMSPSFTLSDIQQTYETILGRPLDPRNFRRRLVSSGLLQSENQLRREGSHRPAALYRFAGNHNPASFLTPDAQSVSPDTSSDS